MRTRWYSPNPTARTSPRGSISRSARRSRSPSPPPDPAWGEVEYAVGGKLLIDDGTVTTSGIDAASSRRARSAIGVKSDGTVVLYEIDGNQSSVSTGLTAAELGEELKELGCVRALCLDGGGSSAMAPAPARRERDLAHLESLGRLAARLRQLHLLYREHPLGRRDCPCRTSPRATATFSPARPPGSRSRARTLPTARQKPRPISSLRSRTTWAR
ncbi:MAG: phosphodiester glycosidase family protein [Butyricicoccaceae bacterium]